jgi:hypothetical protein
VGGADLSLGLRLDGAARVIARQSKRMNATNTLRFISNLLLNIGC